MGKFSVHSFTYFRTILLVGAVSVSAELLLGASGAFAQDCDIQPVSEASSATLATQSNFTCLIAKLGAALSRVEVLEAELEPFRNSSGMVVAFNRGQRSGGGCPPGWSLFESAGGRMIVGAGTNTNTDQNGINLRDYPSFKDDPANAVGGEEKHTLIGPELPPHTHKLPDNILTNPAPKTQVDSGRHAGTNAGVNINRIDATLSTGGGQAHNNMPPYIALFYCKKD
ncbi:hypothetical protein WNZ15_23105 [Roseibium sp. AS2]|uniref:hypothetical protein n=1 Tax=Roseibium sp. AS2 TaxID=3135781 RepID=UPI0031769316